MKPALLFAAAAIVLAALLTASRVSIRVSPRALQAGGSVRVTCTVPRHPGNRSLAAVLDGYTASVRQLDGAEAPVTHTFEFGHVPCGVEEAICVLTLKDGQTVTAAMPVSVVCEP